MSILHDKVALITGSSRGIGAGIARLFAQEGAKVAADITQLAEIEAMRHQIERTFGPIDILIANAGGSFTKPGPLEEISEAGWRASVDGNLTATFLTLKSFLPGMKERQAQVQCRAVQCAE
jgi:3-oxoacyl-[acyl-carrier protein] reductase